MSHFTKCELKMTDLGALKSALDDLELSYEEAAEQQSVKVRGWRGQELEAAMSINMGKYDIGVVDNGDGTYDMVADWWGVEVSKGVTEQEFKDQLNRRYSYHRVLKACEDKGYSVEEEVNEEDGSVQLVVRKWVSE
jgi:hypothetical protein